LVTLIQQSGLAGAGPSKSSEKPARGKRRLLSRAARREQILLAATRAFARGGFAATSLDDVAAEAGVGRVILYRHFESKAELYRAVLSRAHERLVAATGAPEFNEASLEELLAAASEEPAGFRLLFHHASREPEFRQEMDELRASMFAVAHRHLAEMIPDPAWARWASTLVPTVAVEGVIAWLDAGQPDQATAAGRIGEAVGAIIQAAGRRHGKAASPPAVRP
jgi:AcrR family transcriptional regulator